MRSVEGVARRNTPIAVALSLMIVLVTAGTSLAAPAPEPPEAPGEPSPDEPQDSQSGPWDAIGIIHPDNCRADVGDYSPDDNDPGYLGGGEYEGNGTGAFVYYNSTVPFVGTGGTWVAAQDCI